MYKILHIISGHYVYMDDTKMEAEFTKESADVWILTVTSAKSPIFWYSVNHDFGPNPTKEEFEIVEVRDV